ncbi:MerR family transcriptional regulator [Desulfoscipio gibsoniae]|uniref:HTH merR-type domain-containing protein n=1 Tax=Desulfoscipio gibsoniae DSM 7213 TaxID=767817 RepID=R4KRS5_9FIRM|nr:MerR family transcriptional regulator [Desulfoscipio gibsoniae]AGL02306.1 hypothetical protein Desgi_2908 [Desulfoscipio gibsoniae DSM 7213]
MKRYSIFELADEAQKHQINLGTSPVRTIRYYINKEILDKPNIVQMGKKRVSQFDDEHLYKLKIVDYYKKQGLTLEEIRKTLEEHIFWSDFGLEHIKNFMSDIYNPNLYSKTKPITREALAYFLLKLIKNKDLDKDEVIKILRKSVVDANGKSAAEIPLLDGGLSFGSKNSDTKSS